MHSPFAPSMRLHLWLESEQGALIGLGRAMLLARIKQYGSLRQAAESLGISYRAAWGKLRQSQEYLGRELLRKEGKGYVLTAFGEQMADAFLRWHDDVERFALDMAQRRFPWPVRPHASSPASLNPPGSRSSPSRPFDPVSSPPGFVDKEHQ